MTDTTTTDTTQTTTDTILNRATARDMYRDGHTVAHIARTMNRPYNTVWSWIHRTGSLRGRTVDVIGLEWFDRVNGNSYHAVRVYVDRCEVARGQFQYGYGDQYKQTAVELLGDIGACRTRSLTPLWRMAEEQGFTVHTSIETTLKRNVVEWGDGGT